MPERMTNDRRVGAAVTLAVALSGSSSNTTLTPTSYTGFPAAGQGYLYVGNPSVPASIEIVHVTNWATHPWPIERAQDGTTAVAHPTTHEVNTGLTRSSMAGFLGISEGGTLIVNTDDINFNATQFDVTDVAGVANIALAPAGTPAVGTDTIWDAKGDLAAGTGPDAAVRVVVGANGRVLMADSTQTAGVKWEALAAGATFAAPSESVDIADTADEGAAATTVRSDHRHAFPAPSAAYPLDVAAAEVDGTATTPARSDHVHAHGAGYLPDAHHARAHDHSAAGDTTALVPASLNVTGFVRLSGDISPAQLTASVNDYNPTDLATAAVLRLTADAEWSITGLQGGADGRLLVLANVGANTINLVDESGSSTAAYRFALDVNLALTQDTAATLYYDSTSSRWRLIGIGKASAASTSALAADTLWDAAGDLVKGTGNNTAARLARGTADQYLRTNVGATDIEWAANPVTAHVAAGDPHTGYVLESLVDAKGDVLTATAADTPARLAVGTNGHVLKANSATATGLEWAAESGGSGAVATDAIWDAAGDLAIGSGANTAAKLAMGTALQVLRVNAGATTLEWAAAGGGGSSPAQARYSRTAGNYTTTSASFVDIDATNMSLTISTGATRVLITLLATGYNSSGATPTTFFDFLLDGVSLGGASGVAYLYTVDSRNQLISIPYLTDVLSAGSHTFKVQWKTTAGTMTIYGAGSPALLFSVVEIV